MIVQILLLWAICSLYIHFITFAEGLVWLWRRHVFLSNVKVKHYQICSIHGHSAAAYGRSRVIDVVCCPPVIVVIIHKKKANFLLAWVKWGKSHWLVSSCCKPHSFFMAAFAFVPSANYLLVFLLKSILTLVPCSIKALAALLQTDPQRPRGLLRSFVVQQPRGPETHGLVVRVLGRRRRPLETGWRDTDSDGSFKKSMG